MVFAEVDGIECLLPTHCRRLSARKSRRLVKVHPKHQQVVALRPIKSVQFRRLGTGESPVGDFLFGSFVLTASLFYGTYTERVGGDSVMVGARKERNSGGVTAEKKALFLETLAETCSVKAAAEAAGIRTAYCYRLKLKDAAFAA